MKVTKPKIYKRGNVWWLRCTVNGKQIRENLHTDNETTALAMASEWQPSTELLTKVENALQTITDGNMEQLTQEWIENGIRNVKGGRLPSKEWLDTCAYYIELFRKQWKDTSQINHHSVVDYVNKRVATHKQRKTIEKELSAFRKFLGYCWNNHRIKITDIEWPEIQNILPAKPNAEDEYEPGCFSENEIHQLIEALPEIDGTFRVRLFYRLMWYFGCRKGLLERIEWSDFNLANRTLNIRQAVDKSRFNRCLTNLNPEIVGMIERVPNRFGLIFGEMPKDFRRYLHPAAKKLGWPNSKIDKLTNHSIRHSRAVNLLSTGRSLKQVQDWLGHKLATTTNIYLKHVGSGDGNCSID